MMFEALYMAFAMGLILTAFMAPIVGFILLVCWLVGDDA